MRTGSPSNRLLASLSASDYQALAAHMEPVELGLGDTVYNPEDCVDWVYFPESGLFSIVSVMLSGAAVETSVVGREGGVGFLEASSSQIIFSRIFVQIPLKGVRVPARAYREAFDASPALRACIGAHIELLLTECRQQIACHALHQAGQRLAWWLLECQDRTGGLHDLPLTQEFLADMLGCTRPTVSQIAAELQNKGVISYSRGNIKILDMEGLKRASCECYDITEHFRRTIDEWARESFEDPKAWATGSRRTRTP